MRKLVIVAAVAVIVSLGLTVPRGPAAPALADKPVKYEFGELRYLRGGQPRANPFGGGVGQPGQPGRPSRKTTCAGARSSAGRPAFRSMDNHRR